MRVSKKVELVKKNSAAANENDVLSNYIPSPRKKLESDGQCIQKLNEASKLR
jgi:hypothetical protein